MGKGKGRLYLEKKQNNYKYCTYADNPDKEVLQECMYPWSNRCKGDRHMCKKLSYQYLASLSEEERKKMMEKYNSVFSKA
jgi:hypothetical protein